MQSSQHVVNGAVLVGILTCETFRCMTLRKRVALHFVMLLSHVMKTVLPLTGLQRSFPSPGTQVPPAGRMNVVVTVANTRWLWPVNQQHTVHISQQCLRVMAHFRTSVQDTVSVVAKHLGPPSQMNFVHLLLSVHTFVQVPKSVVHTHIHTFSVLSPEEALHMKQENLTKMRQLKTQGSSTYLVFVYSKGWRSLCHCVYWSVTFPIRFKMEISTFITWSHHINRN